MDTAAKTSVATTPAVLGTQPENGQHRRPMTPPIHQLAAPSDGPQGLPDSGTAPRQHPDHLAGSVLLLA